MEKRKTFCIYCGANLNGNRFCQNCGARNDSALPLQQSDYNARQDYYLSQHSGVRQRKVRKSSRLSKKMCLISGAAVAGVIVLIILLCFICGSSGYQGAIKNYEKYLNTYDLEYAMKLVPGDVVEELVLYDMDGEGDFWTLFENNYLEEARWKQSKADYELEITVLDAVRYNPEELVSLASRCENSQLNSRKLEDAYSVLCVTVPKYFDREGFSSMDYWDAYYWDRDWDLGMNEYDVIKYDGAWYIYTAYVNVCLQSGFEIVK